MATQSDQKFCTTCGKPIHVKAEICPHCGVRQPGAASAEGKNKVIAGVLALLLGGLGIHKFYLGQTTMGILYLLFFWTTIPMWIGFVEGILLLLMNDADFNRKYNAGT